MFTKCTCLRCIANKKLYNALHHPGGVTLSWMHSCTYEYALFRHGFGTLWILISTSNGYHVTAVAGQCSTQSCPLKDIRHGCILLNSRHVILKIRISVWKAMSKKLRIIVNLQSMNKAKSEEAPLKLWVAILLERILKVIDILTDTMPANTLNVLNFVRITQHLHAIIVE